MTVATSVLVVEDNFLVALDLQMSLEEMGFVVIGPAGNVSEAVRLMQVSLPHAAVLDINLGAETSFGVADELVVAEVPFVFLSGGTRDTLPPRFSSIPLLEKPVQIARLCDLLNGAQD